MSNETRQIRVLVPAAVAERLEHAAKILGSSVFHLGGRCLEAGLETVVCDLARDRAAELAAFLPPENGREKPDASEKPSSTLRKLGRAEKAAQVRDAELREQRRLQRSPAKSGRDPVD